MADFEALWRRMIKSIAVGFAVEFDENFRRKAFFDKPWKRRRMNERGSILIGTGQLRRSIRKEVNGNKIVFLSHLPYAEIHNEGGEIVVTEKMKRFFWYKYASTKLLAYKYMAMMKTGSKIVIPQRQFVGYHRALDKVVEREAQAFVDAAMKEVAKNNG